MREKEYFLNGGLSGEQHREPVHPNPHPRCWRHPILQGTQEILVDKHGFIVTLFRQAELFFEPFALVNRVVQLRISVSQLFAVYHQFKAFGKLRIRPVALAQGGHFDGIIGDECRLNVIPLALLAEDFIDQFSFTHGLVHLYVQLPANFAQLFLIHSGDIDSGMLFNGVDHGHAWIGSFKIDFPVSDGCLCCSQHFCGDLFQHLFGKLHHPLVILVGNVNFHYRKLRVVRPVHPLVAEVSRKLVNTFKATYDQPLQVKLVGNA